MKPAIAVLTDARDPASGRVIAEELAARGHRIGLVTVDGDDWTIHTPTARHPVDRATLTVDTGAARIRFDFAFIAVHDHRGRGPLQGCLDLAGIPYAGPGQRTALTADDPAAARAALAALDAPHLDALTLPPGAPVDPARLLARFGLPCRVAPHRRALFDAADITRPAALAPAITALHRRGLTARVEAHLPGRAITCGVVALGDRVRPLPLTEPHPEPGRRRTPADLAPALTVRLHALAARAWRALDCRGLARVDFRLDARHDDAPVIVDVDPLPSLERDGPLLAGLLAAELDPGVVLETLMNNTLAARRRAPRPSGPLPRATDAPPNARDRRAAHL